jgi:tetratricopeptide (TPR) repeat protein
MARRAAKHGTKESARPVSIPATSHTGGWAAVTILLVATLVTFAPVCWNDFTTWDDNLNVSHNPYLNPPSFAGAAHFWVAPHMYLYIPVTYTVWSLIAAAARLDVPDAAGIWLNPTIFHAANLLVHLLAALAAYRLLLALTGRRGPACIGALIFALHPVQVESVAWVAGMKDVLCGMFSLLALWQYVGCAQSETRADNPETHWSPATWGRYALATAALILAMLSKPSAMTVPLVALVIDRWIVGRPWRRVLAALWPWALLAAACAIEAHQVQPVPNPADGGHVWARPLLAGAALAFYLYKLIWPAALAVQYHYSPQVLLHGRWIYFAWVVPVVVAIAIWLVRRRARWLAAGAALFVIGLLPVLGLVPFQFERYSLTADHYLYLAMIGPALVVAFGLSRLRERPLKVATGIIVACTIALAIRSGIQTLYWRDTQTLFEHTLAVNPNSDAADNQLGQIALDRNDPGQAEQLALNSIHSQPNEGDAYDLLGNALVRQKRMPEAAEAFRITVEKDPNNYAALTSLGAISAGRDLDEGIRLLRRAIAIEPTYEKAHVNLAIALARANRMREAVLEAETAVRLNPADPQAQSLLHLLLGRGGPADRSAGH